MIKITVGIYADGVCAPEADVLNTGNLGDRFIVLSPSPELTIILNGRDRQAVADARKLAKCIADAAELLEFELMADALTRSEGAA